MRRFLVRLLDLGLVALATVSALLLRSNFEATPEQWNGFTPYLLLTMVAATVIMQATGNDRRIWRFSTMTDYLSLASSAAAIAVCATISDFAYNRLADVARAVPILQAILITAYLVGARVIFRLYKAHRAEKRELHSAAPVVSEAWVLLVGINPIAELYVKCTEMYAKQRFSLCGIISDTAKDVGRSAYGLPILGGISEIDAVIANLEVQGITVRRIAVTSDVAQLTAAHKNTLAALGDREEIEVDYISRVLEYPENSKTRPLVTPPGPAATFWQSDAESKEYLDKLSAASTKPYFKFKRMIEAPIAAALLLVAVVPLLIASLCTLFAVGAPVLFWQYRPGYLGRRFRVYKLRTMHHAYDVNGGRVPDERRYSVFGSLLRMSRLDELPQLLSVVLGHMSFIGPRPLLFIEQSASPAARLLVRPGLTGWAQVNGGRSLSFEDKLALDFWYIAHASFAIDLQIAIKTMKMIVFGEQRDENAIQEAKREFGFRTSDAATRHAPNPEKSDIHPDTKALAS